MIKGNSLKIPLKPLGDKEASIDVGVNNILAVYVDEGSSLLVSGRPLKTIGFYWESKISEYQSMLNRYGLKTSRRLMRVFKRWRRQIKCYIDRAVRNAVERLY